MASLPEVGCVDPKTPRYLARDSVRWQIERLRPYFPKRIRNSYLADMRNGGDWAVSVRHRFIRDTYGDAVQRAFQLLSIAGDIRFENHQEGVDIQRREQTQHQIDSLESRMPDSDLIVLPIQPHDKYCNRNALSVWGLQNILHYGVLDVCMFLLAQPETVKQMPVSALICGGDMCSRRERVPAFFFERGLNTIHFDFVPRDHKEKNWGFPTARLF